MSTVTSSYEAFEEYIDGRKCFVVCGNSLSRIRPGEFFRSLENKGGVVYFKDFEPNPDHSSVDAGIARFKDSGCELIVAAGGGSAMDVAKTIRFEGGFDVPFAAIPTTAGTGSEATHFAVIYRDGVKTSVGDMSMIPDMVLLDPMTLVNLPVYQKKATMADALCHSIESFWAPCATDESRGYALSAMDTILSLGASYVERDYSGFRDCEDVDAEVKEELGSIMRAAYDAGRAINITKTTGGHAMCYKLTTMYGIAHGHAAILCVNALWDFMRTRMELPEPLESRKAEFDKLYECLALEVPEITDADIEVLAGSVNADRMSNNPMKLTTDEIKSIYKTIAGEKK